jgi:hypothetical protein
MEVKSCRVTISDMEGVAHTVELTAATLYEAVALGLREPTAFPFQLVVLGAATNFHDRCLIRGHIPNWQPAVRTQVSFPEIQHSMDSK